MPKTRKDFRCPLFGDPIKFSDNMLPTYCDVIKHYLWIRNEMLELNNGKDPSVKDLCDIIASDIAAIWSKASIPTITHQQVVSRLILYYQKYKNVKKIRNDSKKQIFYNESINKLFDIATCKCVSRELCKCVTKVPVAEENFLKDQRNERKMYIGSVDKVTTQTMQRREIRKRKYEEFAAKCNVTPSTSSSAPAIVWTSRWLTCANRILRLYIGTAKPTNNLKELATFIMKVYAPNWFEIKSKSSCKFGPIHIFNMVKRSLYLRDDLKSVVLNTIQRNAFFMHPENLLLAMLQDENQQIRELALRRVLKARKETKGKKVREFQLPELKVDAENYYDLIEWAKEKITEPPVTMKYSDSEITTKISSGGKLFDIEKYPCHTQAVERCVKLVTEASASVCGPDARDGFIRTRIKSRQEIPSFDTKSQYFRQKEDTETSDTDH